MGGLSTLVSAQSCTTVSPFNFLRGRPGKKRQHLRKAGYKLKGNRGCLTFVAGTGIVAFMLKCRLRVG